MITRMQTNLTEIWEGWTINHSFGMSKKWERSSLMIVMLLGWGSILPILFAWSFVNVVFNGVYTPASLLILFR